MRRVGMIIKEEIIKPKKVEKKVVEEQPKVELEINAEEIANEIVEEKKATKKKKNK